MKGIIVVTVDLPTPDDVVAVVEAMDPPSIPHFLGEVRVAVGEHAQHVIDWLDEDA